MIYKRRLKKRLKMGASDGGGQESGTSDSRPSSGTTQGATDFKPAPGKVALYNQTNQSVCLTIVGQQSNISIDPWGKLTRQFGTINASTELSFWFWKHQDRELARVKVKNGGIYVITDQGVLTKDAQGNTVATATPSGGPADGAPVKKWNATNQVTIYNDTPKTVQFWTNRGLNFSIDAGGKFEGRFDDQVTTIKVQYWGTQTPFTKGKVAIGKAYAITPGGIVAK